MVEILRRHTPKRFNVAFLGSISLSERCLRYLHSLDEINIVGVVGHERHERRWGDRPYTLDTAKKLGLPIIKLEDLKKMDLDLILVVGFNRILKKDIIELPKRGVINLHGSPLPKYRGRNCYIHALLNNETHYGVSMHFIDEGIDTGPIIDFDSFKIASDITARELYDLCMERSYKLFVKNIPLIIQGKISAVPQGEGTTYYKKDIPSNRVDLTWDPQYIYNFIRAMTFPPFEKPFIMVGDKKIYLSVK